MKTARFEIIYQVIRDDRRLLGQAHDAGLIPRQECDLEAHHVELARLLSTLSHELEVNWAGIEIIVRMRRELIANRQQIGQLAAMIRRAELRNQQGPSHSSSVLSASARAQEPTDPDQSEPPSNRGLDGDL